MIAVLVGQGYRPKQYCRILGAAPAAYFVWTRGPVSLGRAAAPVAEAGHHAGPTGYPANVASRRTRS